MTRRKTDRLSDRMLHARRFGVLIVWLILAGAPGFQRLDPAMAGEPVQEPALTEPALQKRIQEIREQADLSEEQRTERMAPLRRALDHLQAAATHEARAEGFDKAAERAPELRRTLERALAKPPEPVEIDVPSDASLVQLEERLSRIRAQAAEAESASKTLEEEAKQRPLRRAAIPEELAAARDALEDVKATLAGAADADGDPADRGRLVHRARKRSLEQQVAALAAERKSYEARRGLLPLRRDRAARDLARARQRVTLWEQAVAERRETEAAAAAREAQEVRQAAAHAHPSIRAIAETNARLAARRTGDKGVAARIQALKEQLDRVDREREQLEGELEQLKQKVEAVGLTQAIGMLLVRKRQERPAMQTHREARRRTQRKISEYQLELIRLEEQRTELAVPEERVTAVLQKAAPADAARREELAPRVRKLLVAQRQLLDALIRDTNTYFALLVDRDNSERRLIRTAEAYSAYLDRHVLWVRNAPALGAATFREGLTGMAWLVSHTPWREVAARLARDAGRQPLLWILVLTGLLGLAGTRVRLRARLAVCRRTGGPPGLQALAWAALLGLPAAGLALLVGWRLHQMVDGPAAVPALATGLLQAGALAWLLAGVWRLIAPVRPAQGAVPATASGAQALRRPMGIFAAVFLLSVFLSGVFGSPVARTWQDSAGRLAFLVALLAVAGLSARFLRPRGEVVAALRRAYARSWVGRAERLWIAAGVGLPLSLVVLSALGYDYSARRVAECLLATGGLVAAAVLLYHGVRRQLLDVRQTLVLRRLRQESAETAGAETTGADEAGAGSALASDPGEEVAALSGQTRRFLQLVVLAAVALGLWWIWADVLPALGMLDRVELWSVGRPAADGTGVERITLAGLLLAVAMAVVAVAAARNLPGMLEMALLQRLPVDRGVRFAITTLSRYVIIGVGVVLVFAEVGIGWSKVQWLIAAMTVGLGFGLQEIFGNFVSGLIILFERPLRVGDTVTVGDVSGTVTQIRIRATTIQQWDRKELVVPNKEFITGRLVNWTLADSILRLDFPVGIAYGSDTALAERLLYDVAEDCERAMGDPPPFVLFRGFGDSALLFELRLYIETLDRGTYLGVWHEVNRKIDDVFRAHGVEIAFPQQDVHVRSVEAAFPVQQLPPAGAGAQGDAAGAPPPGPASGPADRPDAPQM